MESYKIAPSQGGWSISHNNGENEGSYATREAAFEAACFAATNDIKTGAEISINVAPPRPGEAAIGGPAR
jgi:hypothetical protein